MATQDAHEIQMPSATEEIIHKAEETQLIDPNEPKPRTPFQLVTILRWESIWLLFAIFFAMCQGAVPLVFFYVLGGSFGDIATATPDQIRTVTSNMALNITYIAIAAAVVSALASFFFTYGSQRIGVRMRQEYFNQITRQEIGYFDIKKAGSLASGLSDDASKATDVFSPYMQTLSQNTVQFIGGIIIALVSDWQMSLFNLVAIPLMLVVFGVQGPIISKVATLASVRSGESMSTANEVITSMRTVRSMAGEDKEVERYSKQLSRVGVLGFITSMTKGIGILFVYFFFHGAQAIAFWWGGREMQDGTSNIGNFIKSFGLILMASIGLFEILGIMPEVIKSQASIMQLLKVILRKPTQRFRGGKTIDDIRGHITFKDVTFKYPSRPNVTVLKNFSLDIQPGTSVALVGQSGSGKSTIVGLIEQWYAPESGSVQVDGVEIGELDPMWWHRYLGIVSQEPTLFATTIRKNISYAVDTINGHIRTEAIRQNRNISDDEIQALLLPVTQELVEKAAVSANAHDFIMKLPDGYDTIIGERGVSLSGGQKQRIAIARSVLQNPKVLLLDEATSALDSTSEGVVQEALEKLMVGRTSIVIAHRLTTVQDCNNIVVMRQGVVVEMGPHDQLIQNVDGAYYKLAARQMTLGKSESSDSLQSQDTNSSDEVTSTDEVSLGSVETTQLVSEVKLETIQQEPKKKRRVRRRKETFTNEAEVKDVREPKLRNPFIIFKLLGPEVVWIILAAIFSFAFGINPIVIYYFLGQVVTAATPTRNEDGSFIPFPPGYSLYDQVAIQARNVAILAGTLAFAIGLQFFLGNFAYERVTQRVRRLYFSALSRQEMGFFDIKKSGKLLSVIGEDVNNMAMGLTIKMTLFMQNVGMAVVGLIMALVASWQTGLIMLAAGAPSIGIIIILSGISLSYWNKQIIHISASALTTANEVIGAIRTVRSMAGEEREQRRFGEDMKKMRNAGFWKAVTMTLMLGTIQFCIFGVAALCFWYGGTLIANGTLPAGALLQVFGNMLFAVLGVSSALGEVQNFAKSFAAAHEIELVTERIPAITPEGGIVPEQITGNIEFKDITFEYPSRPGVTIMKDFNLVIKQGQHVALVGESGSGKSTITGLLERFYDPLQGSVLLDGRDIKEIDLKWLHRNVAIVTQEPTLFATSIRKNITYAVGDENVTMDQVIECAKAANCHDFITQLPNGYDTMIGERGVSMSGGQKQRIAIARAMIQNASLLLLDEATSALDNEAETLVQAALDKLMVGKTTIVIAHRLSTVRDCDMIVAMKQGRVIEMGTHDQLLQNKSGLYYSLAQKQMEFGQSH
jgi:ATP-binding cassette subfamily B (MDR/TAP) protein 1